MAGALLEIDSVSGITADTLKELANAHSGGHGSVTFIVDIIAITGTWDFNVRFKISPTSNTIPIAFLGGQTTTGLKVIPLTADFNTTRRAIPAPVDVLYDNTVAGSLTAKVYAVYGD